MGQAVIEEVVVAEGMLTQVVFVVAVFVFAEGNRVISKNHGRLADSFHGFVEWDALSTAFCMRATRSGTGLSRQSRQSRHIRAG
ncbi:MAG: hypothetical protein F4Y38_07400 [Gemmatimonadetes bacterium]|nr:hypothetical protein [Gemmatimonadota bacterium]MXY49115.1 hypothetical protein [Gemmatimonadota bacterium]MYG85446.1 hypothetical protein [Gemmatimonadota bacterium]MYJ88801.1 hypothetical protein [Gemmatimonadota bacterium]